MKTSRPLSVYEVYDRFQDGRKVHEDTWDCEIVPNNAAMLKEKYEIEFGSNIIPEDADLADRLFSAGMEMLVITGFFNPDLGRTMHITGSEVSEGLKRVTRRLRLGRGKDEEVCNRRRGSDHAAPAIMGGPTGAPASEDMLVTLMHAYASESSVNALASGVMATVDGRTPTANTPWEVKAAMAEIRAMKEGMTRAGRPGMSMGRLVSSFESDLAKNDLHLCSQLNEMKVDMAALNMLAGWTSAGNTIMIEHMPIFGGYCGGIEETAICSVATTLASVVMLNANIHLDGTIHMSYGVTTARETLQISSHVAAAVDANTEILLADQFFTAAGPCTEMCLFETAAQAICGTVSGREMLLGVASSKGIARDRTTPMEARMMGEAAAAAAGMKAQDANSILGRLIDMYEPELPQPQKGKRFQDCYDVRTVTPSDEYFDVYDNAVRTLVDIGLNIKY